MLGTRNTEDINHLPTSEEIFVKSKGIMVWMVFCGGFGVGMVGLV